MAYLALYRKYRPSTFEELVGQEKIIKVISNAVKNNKVSHAYLFCGPRGTGKTTMAKLIAKIVNCEELVNFEPCGKCNSCLSFVKNNNDDIIEIDAASNNGVDEIREIRDNINLTPSMCKYKIYIIDEIHMLTTGAFNALLKTLEEPPAHVIFILATTEPHKIPVTITSRCQKFSFMKLEINQIVKKLKDISEKEKIDISEDSLYQIAKLSDGGMRDAINMLDQLSLYNDGRIELTDVYEINGLISIEELCDLFQLIFELDKEKIIDFIDRKSLEGKKIIKLVEEFMMLMKDFISYKIIKQTNVFIGTTEKIQETLEKVSEKTLYKIIYEMNNMLNEMKTSDYPELLLEIGLFEIGEKYFLEETKNYFPGNNLDGSKAKESIIKEVNSDKNTVDKMEDKKEQKRDKEENSNEIENLEEFEKSRERDEVRVNNAFATANKSKLLEVKNKWSDINEYLIDKKYSVIAGILKDTVVVVVGDGYIILSTKLSSIKSRLDNIIDDATKFLFKILDSEYKIVVLLDEEWEKKKMEYVNSIKENKIYELIEEKPIKKVKVKQNTVPIELIDVLGEDIIEIK